MCTMIKLRSLRTYLSKGSAPNNLTDAAVKVLDEPPFLVLDVVFKTRKHLEQEKLVSLLQN